MRTASGYLRENVLAVTAIFLALNAGAYAVTTEPAAPAKQLLNADLATGSVDSRVLASGAVEGRNIQAAAVGPKKMKLDQLTKFLQTRVNGECQAGETVQGVLADGGVTCGAQATGTISGISTSGGLTGGGTSGALDIGTDPTVLQSRVDDACAGANAIQAVNEDGSVTCQATGTGTVTSVDAGFGLTGGPITGSGSLAADPTVLQRRVSACPSGGAIQEVNADGTVTCATVDVTANSGYVQLNDNPSQTTPLLNFGGVIVRATCLSNGNAQITIGANGGAGQSIDYQARTNAGGLVSGTLTNGNTATIVDTATNDLGRFNVLTSTGRQIDGTFLAWAIATTGGIDCVFTASALTF
jgi:hypothetical protein